MLGSTLFAVDKNGEVIAHAIYDPWGNPLTETYTDANHSGLENLNNFTGYTYDITLALYFAQNRFYDAETHRFTQEDTAKDSTNWYVYCFNSPVLYIDYYGEDSYIFYDPNNYKDKSMTPYVEAYAKEITRITHTKTHLIAMSTIEELITEWNKMGNNGTEPIEVVVFLGHGNPYTIRIWTDPNYYIDRDPTMNERISLGFFDNLDLRIQNIGYFFVLECDQGNTKYEKDHNTSIALDILNSKQHISAVIASDTQTRYYQYTEIRSEKDGMGFKVYRQNPYTNEVSIVAIGHQFASIADMYIKTLRTIPRKLGTDTSEINNSTQTGRIIWSKLNLREAPGTEWKSLGMVSKNDTFIYLDSYTNTEYIWYRVYMTSGNKAGTMGFIASVGAKLDKE